MKGLAGQPEPVPRVEDVRIPGSAGNEIQAGMYLPDTKEPPPVMVYMHGGGWVVGDHTAVDVLARALVNRSL